MAYRDVKTALTEHRRMLVEEIERLDGEIRRLSVMTQRRDKLRTALDHLDAQQSSIEKPRRLLEQLRVASPCSARSKT